MLSKKLLCKISVIILICVVLGYWAKREMPIARVDFSSFEEFCEVGARGYLDLPDCAEDVKYYLHHPVLYMHCIYAFSINDEEEYDAYMEELKDYSCIELGSAGPEWGWNNGYSYTEDELEEMRYLEKNYEGMDYKEILSMSRHYQGFNNGYGASVKDYIDLERASDSFPDGLPFFKVISDSIQDYTVLYFSPIGVGTVGTGIVVNEKTQRFVMYYYGGIR